MPIKDYFSDPIEFSRFLKSIKIEGTFQKKLLKAFNEVHNNLDFYNKYDFSKYFEDKRSHYLDWKKDIIANKLPTFTRPLDMQYHRDVIFSWEERTYLDKLNISDIRTLKNNLSHHIGESYKKKALCVFLVAILDLEIKIFSDKSKHISKLIKATHQVYNQRHYYGFYDRSFIDITQIGLCEVSIYNDFWAKIKFHYPPDITSIHNSNNDSPRDKLVLFAKVEYYGKNNVMVLKNFEDINSKFETNDDRAKQGPTDSFMAFKYYDTEQKIIIGQNSSINRKKSFLYSTVFTLIEKTYFNSEKFWKEIDGLSQEKKSTSPEEVKIKSFDDIKRLRDINDFDKIGPLYYFLYHQSLIIENQEEQFINKKKLARHEIPFFEEWDDVRKLEGYYLGFNCVVNIDGKSQLIETKLKIFRTGRVEIEIPNDGNNKKIIDNSGMDLRNGFIKSAKQNEIIISLRYNTKEHYSSLQMNLEFTRINNSIYLIGSFSTKSVYTNKNLAARIIFQKVEEDIYQKTEIKAIDFPEALEKLKSKKEVLSFFQAPDYDYLSDSNAISEIRKSDLKSSINTKHLEGEYYVLVTAKDSNISGQIPDKIPFLSINELVINKSGKGVLIDDDGLEYTGVIEANKKDIILVLRNFQALSSPFIIICFHSEITLKHVYGTFTCFSAEGSSAESYQMLLWRKQEQIPGSIIINRERVKLIESQVSKYKELFKDNTNWIVNPRIKDLDAYFEGHIITLMNGTELMKMIRTKKKTNPEAEFRFKNHRSIYFESAMYYLFEYNSDREKSLDLLNKIRTNLVKSHQQGFASLIYKGISVIDFLNLKKKKSKKPSPIEELLNDYELFTKQKNRIIKINEIQSIVFKLWGDSAFEDFKKILNYFK